MAILSCFGRFPPGIKARQESCGFCPDAGPGR
jgi:hypothetical protein